MSVHYIKGDQPTTVNIDDEKEPLVFVRGGTVLDDKTTFVYDNGFVRCVRLVELTDECIDKIAEAVVQKLRNEVAE